MATRRCSDNLLAVDLKSSEPLVGFAVRATASYEAVGRRSDSDEEHGSQVTLRLRYDHYL